MQRKALGICINITIFCLSVIVALWNCDFGFMGIFDNIDWSNHLLLIDYIFQGGVIKDITYEVSKSPIHLYSTVLQDLAFLPLNAHKLVAQLAHLLDVSPIRAFNSFIAVLLVLLPIAQTLRFFESLDYRVKSSSLYILIPTAVTFLIVSNIMPLRGMLTENCFYYQAFGIVLAFFGLMVFRIMPYSLPVALLYILTYGHFLLNTHMQPALYFYAGATLLVFSKSSTATKSIAHSLFIAFVSLLWIWFQPIFQAGRQVSMNNGRYALYGVDIAFLENTHFLYSLIIFCLLVFAITVCWHRPQNMSVIKNIVSRHYGLLAAIIVLFSVYLNYIFNNGSAYSVSKALPVSIFECAVSLSFIIFSWLKNNNLIKNKILYLPQTIVFWIIVLFCFPFPDFPVNHTELIKIRNSLLEKREFILASGKRYYPQYRISPSANYYLYRSILRQPVDEESANWFFNGTCNGVAVPIYYTPEIFSNGIYAGGEINMANPLPEVYFTSQGWRPTESWGRWICGPTAGLLVKPSWNTSTTDTLLTMSLGGYLRGVPSGRLLVDISVNDKKIKTLTISTETFQLYAIRIPAGFINESCILIEWHIHGVKGPTKENPGAFSLSVEKVEMKSLCANSSTGCL